MSRLSKENLWEEECKEEREKEQDFYFSKSKEVYLSEEQRERREVKRERREI